jgi:hypothetical protein
MQQRAEDGRAGKSAWLDPERREVLAWCEEHGIPPSEFRTWSDDDQDEVLGFRREKAKVCQCGTHPDEWERDRNAYTIEIYECPGCRQLELARAELSKMDLAERAGKYVYLIPTKLAVALQEAREEAQEARERAAS